MTLNITIPSSHHLDTSSSDIAYITHLRTHSLHHLHPSTAFQLSSSTPIHNIQTIIKMGAGLSRPRHRVVNITFAGDEEELSPRSSPSRYGSSSHSRHGSSYSRHGSSYSRHGPSHSRRGASRANSPSALPPIMGSPYRYPPGHVAGPGWPGPQVISWAGPAGPSWVPAPGAAGLGLGSGVPHPSHHGSHHGSRQGSRHTSRASSGLPSDWTRVPSMAGSRHGSRAGSQHGGLHGSRVPSHHGSRAGSHHGSQAAGGRFGGRSSAHLSGLGSQRVGGGARHGAGGGPPPAGMRWGQGMRMEPIPERSMRSAW